jgi:hypothetical protein
MLTESCEKIRLKSYPHEVVLYSELSTMAVGQALIKTYKKHRFQSKLTCQRQRRTPLSLGNAADGDLYRSSP